MLNRSVARTVIATVVVILSAQTVGAQCENAWANNPYPQTDNCSGTNQQETKWTSKLFWLNSSVSCNQSGYFGGPTGSSFAPVEAVSTCGLASQGTEPQCLGTLGTMWPWSFNGDSYAFKTVLRGRLMEC